MHNALIVEFDSNGKGVQNTGKCSIEQWAEVAHGIVMGSAPGVGHRYIVEFGPCVADSVIPPAHANGGLCCDQKLSKVTYTFKKGCTVSALQKTCMEKASNHNEMKLIIYKQCDSCMYENQDGERSWNSQTGSIQHNKEAVGDGCAAFGYCGKTNPFSNVMPPAVLCDRMCQPDTERRVCRARHIFSELTNVNYKQFSAEERRLIEIDDDFQELSIRCAQECRVTKDNFACVVMRKVSPQTVTVIKKTTITTHKTMVSSNPPTYTAKQVDVSHPN